MNRWLYLLLLAVPVAVLAEALHAPPLASFVLASLGLVPLAGLIGLSTEVLAERFGQRIGGLLNNLVVADNKRFGQFVGIFITVIFAIISQGVSAAAGILDDSGVGDDGGLPGDPASGSGGSTSLDDMLSTIEDSITQDVSSAFDNLTGSIGDIVSGIGDTISSVRDTLGGLVSTVSDVFHSITSVVSDINENLIKPITGPITAILENYKTLQAELTKDLHSGITGLLKVPGDIANALTSIDATMTRTVSMLGAANRDVIHSELGPGVGAGFGIGVERTTAALASGLDGYTSDERDHMIKHLHEDPSVEALDALADKILGVLKGEYGLVGKIVGTALDVLLMVPHLLLFQEPKSRAYQHLGNAKWPTEALDAATAVAAWVRGILPESEVDAELLKHGFNEDRRAVLKEIARTLPAEADALEQHARKILDDEGLAQIFKARGWREDDAARMREMHKRLPDPLQAIMWYHRKRLTRDELQTILDAYDYRFADTQRLEEMSWQQPGPLDLITYVDRRNLVNARIAAESLTHLPEQALLDELHELSIPDKTAALLWVNHFQHLPPPLAVAAYFRGYINRPQLDALLEAAAVPAEERQNYIDLQRPLINFRVASSMLANGTIDEGKARDIFREHGFTDTDISVLIAYGRAHAKAPTTNRADELHGLTVGAVTSLYAEGTLEQPQALELLTHLGHGAQAAALELQLVDIRVHTAERRAETDIVIAEAQSGHLSHDDAQRQLEALGLTTGETARALTALNRALTVRTNLPSPAEMTSMYKHGLMTRTQLAQSLGLHGYSDAWTELLIKLAEQPSHASAAHH